MGRDSWVPARGKTPRSAADREGKQATVAARRRRDARRRHRGGGCKCAHGTYPGAALAALGHLRPGNAGCATALGRREAGKFRRRP